MNTGAGEFGARVLVPALRRVAHCVDVPGAPLTLQLDAVVVTGDSVSIGWSFADPEIPPDPSSRGGRIRGAIVVRTTSGARADEQASAWWARAQLQAAQRFKRAVDADWIPGEPVRRREWSVAGAWQALLDHLATDDADVDVVQGEIRVAHPQSHSVYRINPEEWAAYINRVEAADHHEDDYIVPAAMPLVDGLPLWVVDELTWTQGAHGPVVALTDGRLVGLGTG